MWVTTSCFFHARQKTTIIYKSCCCMIFIPSIIKIVIGRELHPSPLLKSWSSVTSESADDEIMTQCDINLKPWLCVYYCKSEGVWLGCAAHTICIDLSCCPLPLQASSLPCQGSEGTEPALILFLFLCFHLLPWLCAVTAWHCSTWSPNIWTA